MQDVDGSVNDVIFSVNAPPTWWPYQDVPNDQFVDASLSGGWMWTNIHIDWSITDIAQADFNNDGDTDLAVAVDVTDGAGPDFIAVMTNNGNGIFNTTSLVTLFAADASNYNPSQLAIGDFNEDGFMDIAVADSGPLLDDAIVTYVVPGRFSELLNDGTGNFNGYTDFTSNFPTTDYGPDTSQLALGDFTGDGHLDVLGYDAVAGQFPLWIGDGTGAFTYNRFYDYGSSWDSGGSLSFPVGSSYPSTTRDATDMLGVDLDEHEDGGTDVVMVGQGGLLTLFDYIRGLDTTQPLPNDFDLFGPGNVIGRAFLTGMTAGEAGSAGFHYIYKTGTTYQTETSSSDDFWMLNLGGDNVDMFQVGLDTGQTLSGRLDEMVPGGSDPVEAYWYVYDNTGTVVASGDNTAGGTIDPTAQMLLSFTASSESNYYVAIAGMELVTDDDAVDPFTGYFTTADALPDGGSDMDYTLALSSDGAAGPLTHEAAGNSLAVDDLMEDDYNRTTLLRDVDVVVANPVNDTVTIMLGNRTTDSRGRLAYRNLLDSGAFSPHDIGHSPTDIAIYNIDGDTARDIMGEAGYDWGQGSTGDDPYYEVYTDLVTTNADGTMTIAINAGRYSSGINEEDLFGIQPTLQSFVPNFYTASLGLGYTMANNAFGGPLQDATGVVVGDFNADGVTDFAVAEQYRRCRAEPGLSVPQLRAAGPGHVCRRVAKHGPVLRLRRPLLGHPPAWPARRHLLRHRHRQRLRLSQQPAV